MDEIVTEQTEQTEPTERPAQKIIPRWGRIIAWVGLFALLAVVAMLLLRNLQGPVAVGQTPPSFTLTSFDGKQYGPAEMSGKVVLVNFWAS
ncbi:MAG TPA: hypothetical protein VF831_05455, partial [Anaerolineales bacterium]